MDGWTIGLIAVVVLGLAAIVYGALADRARHRRRREEMLAPPRRTIPHLAPDQPSPQYLSELQARRSPSDAQTREQTPAQRAALDQGLRSAATVRIPAPMASPSFVTDAPSGRAVLEDPAVLLCSDEISSLREVLPVMERCLLSDRPLVIAAPGQSAEMLSTAEVNVIQRRIRLVIVTADDHARAMISELTSAVATSISDRQAGYLPPEHLGRCPRWVANRTESYVFTTAEFTTAEVTPGEPR